MRSFHVRTPFSEEQLTTWFGRRDWSVLWLLGTLRLLVADPHRLRLAVLGGVQVLALLIYGLGDLNLDAVLLRKRIVAYACYLPAYFHACLTARDLEAVGL